MTTCTRCNEADAAGFCCEAHGKQLCHRCYRRTHFVEICMPGCPDCEREGLNPNAIVDRVPKPKPAPLSEKWANMPSAEPTSAQLARVTEERDLLVQQLTAVTDERNAALDDSTQARAARDVARGELAATEIERDDARALVASVARSNWVVARDANYPCERCHLTIQRGEAYTADDAYWHVHCPDPVNAYDALYCTTCYSRYLEDTEAAANHHHPLIPVRVTVAHR